jgi:hypothetical protein
MAPGERTLRPSEVRILADDPTGVIAYGQALARGEKSSWQVKGAAK